MFIHKIKLLIDVFILKHKRNIIIASVFVPIGIIAIIMSVYFAHKSYLIRVEERLEAQRLLSLHPVTFSEANIFRQRYGFVTAAMAETPDFTLTFYFSEGIDTQARDICDTIQRYIDVFIKARDYFARGSQFVFFIDREQLQQMRVRIPYIPLMKDLMLSGNLFLHSVNTTGYVLSLYFRCAYQREFPAWLCSGLEDYLMENEDVVFLSDEELKQWLHENTYGSNPPFGDYWFARQLTIDPAARSAARNVAYTLVRRWSDTGLLREMVLSATASRDHINGALTDYMSTLVECTDNEIGHSYFYNFSDIEVLTEQGRYVFKESENVMWMSYNRQSYVIQEYISYMDAGSVFLKEFLHVKDQARAVTHFYPNLIPIKDYGIIDSDLHRRGFAQGNYAVLANATLQLYIHELTHVYMGRVGHPPPWLVEGMAVLSEIKWPLSDLNPHPNPSHRHRGLNTLVRWGQGWQLIYFVDGSPYNNIFSTYQDGGSFVTFLYENFGMEKLLEFYADANYMNNTPLTQRIYGYTMDELIYQWQLHLLSGVTQLNYVRPDWWRVCLEGVSP